MADTRHLRNYISKVDEINALLVRQWRAVSKHLSDGLAAPVATSTVLRKVYAQPDRYPAPDGRMRRIPARALYGFGEGAKQRFESDLAFYNHYCEGVRAQIARDNSAVDYWMAKARSGDREGIGWYCRTLLPAVLAPIPDWTGPAGYLRTAYSVEQQRTLVIDRFVPGIGVVPESQRYDMRGARSNPHAVSVPTQNRPIWYLDFLAQVALLTAHRLFLSEISVAVDVAIVNCLATLRNPASGHDEAVALLSVRVSKEQLGRINLAGVNAVNCVVELGARITKQPGEYAPITPFAGTDEGIVTVVTTEAPLVTLDPTAFELLVTELLRRMGLRASSTGRTGDGGIDCEAYDDRPVVGGKVIVQVKRYTNVVPPSVVRDLFGTVHASGATKGVLVTTSSFGPESRSFVQGKPLELIDGVQLDALLKQYNLEARSASQVASPRSLSSN